VLAVLLGLWTGLYGTVYGIVAVTLAFCIAMLVVPVRITGCRPLPMLAGLVSPFLSSLVAVGAFFAIANGHAMNTLWTLVALTGGFLVYVLVMLAIDRKNLVQDWTSVRAILARQNLA
jgi:hypothetical protein